MGGEKPRVLLFELLDMIDLLKAVVAVARDTRALQRSIVRDLTRTMLPPLAGPL
jgi:hypothetical protein